MTPIRIILADDQIGVRSALRLWLEHEPDLRVVGEAADATGLLRAIADKTPDLVLLDWELPGLPAEQLVRLLFFERPALKIIAMSGRPQMARRARAAGVHAFLNKSEPGERVLALIRETL